MASLWRRLSSERLMCGWIKLTYANAWWAGTSCSPAPPRSTPRGGKSKAGTGGIWTDRSRVGRGERGLYIWMFGLIFQPFRKLISDYKDSCLQEAGLMRTQVLRSKDQNQVLHALTHKHSPTASLHTQKELSFQKIQGTDTLVLSNQLAQMIMIQTKARQCRTLLIYKAFWGCFEFCHRDFLFIFVL